HNSLVVGDRAHLATVSVWPTIPVRPVDGRECGWGCTGTPVPQADGLPRFRTALGLLGALGGAVGTDVHVALLLDLDLLLADLARDPLGVLDHPLADLDLLGHHGVLADVDLLLADGDADLLALADDVGRGPPVHGGPLDD